VIHSHVKNAEINMSLVFSRFSINHVKAPIFIFDLDDYEYPEGETALTAF